MPPRLRSSPPRLRPLEVLFVRLLSGPASLLNSSGLPRVPFPGRVEGATLSTTHGDGAGSSRIRARWDVPGGADVRGFVPKR